MQRLSLLERATDPLQYENNQLTWEANADLSSPRSSFIWEYLQPHIERWRGKAVLDIGAGTGWFLNEVQQRGAYQIVGIEPALKNIRLAQLLFPNIEIIHTSLADYRTQDVFDTAVAVLSLNHILNVPEAFTKIATLLKQRGELFVIVPDFDYFKMPRSDYEMDLEFLNDNEYVISIRRRLGTIADVVRKKEVYEVAARSAGLHLVNMVPMKPTVTYIQRVRQLELFKNQAIFQLLWFQR